jgi:nitrite reductase (NADH) small subunit
MKSSDSIAMEWYPACQVNDVPRNGGVCVKLGEQQIALFHFTRNGEWYASQNSCPHRNQMALSRGMIGSLGEVPKVACPFHKKSFSLIDGRCLGSEQEYSIQTFPVKIENNTVFIGLIKNQN